MLKNLSLGLLFFGVSSCYSQILVNTLNHDTCLNKRFSIVFYIVLDSNYSVRSATQPTLDAIINVLNDKFKPICVSFARCSTVFIPNYSYNRWKRSVTDPAVTSNWYTEKTINFYIVDSVKDEPQYIDQRGYAYPPPLLSNNISKDVIVAEQFRSSPLTDPDFYLIIHNMGHFFGLSHTWGELNPIPAAVPPPPSSVVTQEFADGTNSSLHGDTLRDTEADPGLTAQELDGKGQRYIRPLDNYMSFFVLACQFTQEQYNLMARIIYQKRLYLH